MSFPNVTGKNGEVIFDSSLPRGNLILRSSFPSTEMPLLLAPTGSHQAQSLEPLFLAHLEGYLVLMTGFTVTSLPSWGSHIYFAKKCFRQLSVNCKSSLIVCNFLKWVIKPRPQEKLVGKGPHEKINFKNPVNSISLLGRNSMYLSNKSTGKSCSKEICLNWYFSKSLNHYLFNHFTDSFLRENY